MTREEILEAIKDLAKSQGYYGRLLRAIEEDETILNTLDREDIDKINKTSKDLRMRLEGDILVV